VTKRNQSNKRPKSDATIPAPLEVVPPGVPRGFELDYIELLGEIRQLPEFTAMKPRLLVQLLQLMRQLDAAHEAVELHGVLVPGSTGQLTANPAATLAASTSERIANLSGILGLTARARTQKAPEPPADADNPWLK
jgi:P27 family predicted phage terminase small subunit